MSNNIPGHVSSRAEYAPLLNKAFKYIESNLSEELSLNSVARHAHYSPFHFHRVFRLLTGETLNNYIKRRRLEESASQLIRTDFQLSEIAIQNGFKSLSSFSRSFKQHYQLSPSKFRLSSPNRYSKIRQTKGKNGQVETVLEKYICDINKLMKWMNSNANIKIEHTPNYNCPATNHIGINGVAGAFERLIKWSNPHGLLGNPNTKLGRIFYDSFKITAPDQVRMAIFMITEKVVETSGEIIQIVIPSGKHIVCRYEILPNEFEQAWSSLFIWMNEQGYAKRSEHPYEIYQNDFREHPEGKFIVDFCIPVR